MAIQKKHGKGRLDKYYRLAKEKGYRARAAFKLIQLNKKYHFLEKSKVLLDLCAAPGSWCQVASEVMPAGGLIVGVDLAPIKPIPRCILFQSDITTDKCRATIRQHLKSWKADTVLHDGAPNVGTAWVQDAFSQAELVLQSLRLATDFLMPGGTFVTKIFRSKDYNSLLWVFNQLFAKVEATKPPSSRNVSAEIFVVCREYKAPKKIDPRFLDPKSVFAELAEPTPNNEAKVFNPEKKKRKRQGYEEGDYTQHKETPVSEFIQTTDPIAMLGGLNKLSFEQGSNGDLALATLDRMPDTTQEIRDCCADLKVLGRKEFKMLLRWRLKVREEFGFKQKKKSVKDEASGEVAEVESMDEEMQIQEDMQRIKDQADSKRKRERRKENERKSKELTRMQMNMTTPSEIGLDQAGPYGEDSMFNMKSAEKVGDLSHIAKSRMHTVMPKTERKDESEGEEEEEGLEDDEEGDNLEGQLDAMYEDYQEQRQAKDAKYRAKRARKGKEDDEFEDFSDREVASDDEVVSDEGSEDSSDDGVGAAGEKVSNLALSNVKQQNTLSRRATIFFDQDVFRGIDGLEDSTYDDSGIEMDDESEQTPSHDAPKQATESTPSADGDEEASAAEDPDEEEDAGFELVKRPQYTNSTWSDEDENPEPTKNGRPDVDIITAEAMTMAHALATGKTTRQSLQDDAFNRYSFRDVEGLPSWFVDDEGEHSTLQRPTTAAAAAAIKEKQRALNARPIKKVREAQARKKFKAAQRLEKLKRKSALLVEDGEMSEKDKADAVRKLMSKAAKKKPKQKVSVVVARGGNRGISGRPRGTKGKYKMVDARMKKDMRAEKRKAKRQR